MAVTSSKVYVFENTDAGEAAGFTSDDYLVFSNTSVTATNIGVSAGTGVGAGITLTAGGVSLAFNSAEIAGASQNGQVQFDDGSSLVIGANTTTGDELDLSTSTVKNVIYGLAGDDSIIGSNNGDYIYGGAGGDTVMGGSGNDHIYGNALTSTQGADDGADYLSGGNGNDYVQGNAGSDTILGGDGNDRLYGGSGNDTIQGGIGIDTINGNQGDDVIDGGAGNDILRGGQGNDSIVGGADNDILYGDLGNDTLNGGAGFDVLFGGDGKDVFAFTGTEYAGLTFTGATANLTDVIGDFVHGTDRIVFDGTSIATADILLDKTGSTFTNVEAAATYAATLISAHGVDNSVAAIAVGSDTYLFYDADAGTGAFDAVVKVIGVAPTAFTSGDFAATVA